MVVHGAHLRLGRAADLQHQLGNALDVLGGEFRVHTALEAVARIGREVEVARTASNGLGEPESSFDVDVLGVVRHGGVVTTHDARQRFHRAVIRNHTHLGGAIQLHGVAVQELQGFTLFAPAHGQPAVDLVQIKNVAGPAQLKHHVVGDVDQGADRALAAARQAIHHPLGGLHLRVHIAHNAAREATTQVSRLNFYRQLVLRSNYRLRVVDRLQGRARQGRQFTRNTVHAQAVRQVGRQLQREQGVVQVQVFANVLPQGRIHRQLQQAAGIVVDAQLLGRAQHAVAGHAAQFADLDLERLAIGTGGQLCTHRRARNANAHARVGRAADDVQQLRATYIHLAHAQAIRVGVLHGFFDFTDHNARESGSNRLQLLHFQTSHGQGVGQLLGGQVGVAILAQPRFRKLHSQSLWRSCQRPAVLAGSSRWLGCVSSK